MELSFSRESLIRVLCEKCLRSKDRDCTICEGVGSYYWDSSSLVCFTQGGELIQIRSENGQVVESTFETPAAEQSLKLSEMLDYLDLWVKLDPVRRWKLSADDSGWHCTLLFNRVKKEGTKFTGVTMDQCLAWAYKKIIS